MTAQDKLPRQPSRECLQQSVAPVLTEQMAYDMGAKGAPATEAERVLFESWMRGHCWALCAEWDGQGYRSTAEVGGDVDPRAMRTRQLFAAWRDRAALQATPPAQEHATPLAGQAQGDALDAGAHIKLTIEYRGMVNEKLLSSYMVTQAKDANDIAGAHVMSAIGEIDAARAAGRRCVMAEQLWVVVRFPDGSWSTGGKPTDPDYSQCEVWQIPATSREAATKKAQARRSRVQRAHDITKEAP